MPALISVIQYSIGKERNVLLFDVGASYASRVSLSEIAAALIMST